MEITYTDDNLISVVKAVKAYKSDNTSITYYHGCTDYFPEISFSEYNFSYIIDKLNLSGKFKSYYFDNDLKNKIGKDINDVDLLNKTLVPTIKTVADTVADVFEYFGSIEINGGYIYVISIPETYNKVEIFDTTDLSDDSVYKVKINFSDTESSFKKLVCVYISSSGDVKINLSYKSWYIDNNRNRNQSKYLLRNDYYRDTNPIKKLEDSKYYIDERSGTILGESETKTVSSLSFPIYNRKKNIINSWKYNSKEIYSPYKIYKRGDVVAFYKHIYKSLRDDNINNNPALTKEWIYEN